MDPHRRFMGPGSYLGSRADRTSTGDESMNEYGDSEPTDEIRPVEGLPREPAPTWQWTGTHPGTPPANVPPTYPPSSYPPGPYQSAAYPPPSATWAPMPGVTP